MAESTPKAKPIPSPSMKLWTESPSGAEDADPSWARVSHRLVAVVQDQHPLGEEEAEEAGRDQGGGEVGVADPFDPLGQHVEQGDGDDDAAGQRQQRRQAVGEAQADRGRRSGSRRTVSPASGIAIDISARLRWQRGQIPRRSDVVGDDLELGALADRWIARSSAGSSKGTRRPQRTQTMWWWCSPGSLRS